ncbi:MAG: transglutaminase family protein [Victivallaceae bacterium]|nr:transglutaminase family protein [Victivallaceae bacterium]
MTPRKNDYLYLINLLDDEDENVCAYAMRELMDHAEEAASYLAELQECPNELVRRRIHQLQTAILLRERRKRFAEYLNSRRFDPIAALIQSHLLWYDNDSVVVLQEAWRKFQLDFERSQVKTPAELGAFFREQGFTGTSESTLHPEHYCIGVVLDNRTGANSVLSLIAAVLARMADLPASVVRMENDFALLISEAQTAYEERLLLLPGADFKTLPVGAAHTPAELDDRDAVRFATLNLLSAAVNSDSFRYIFTLSSAISGVNEPWRMDFLPYPYSPSEEPGDEKGPEQTHRPR